MMFLALILFGGLSYLCIKAFLNLRKLKDSESPEVKKRKKNAVIFGCIGLFGTWVCLGDVRLSISEYFRSSNQMEYHNTGSPSVTQQPKARISSPAKRTNTYASDGLKCTPLARTSSPCGFFYFSTLAFLQTPYYLYFMSTKYQAKHNEKTYFVTITTVNWIDVFTRLNHKTTIIDSLKYCQQQKGLEIYAYVLMPSHLHMLCRAKEGFQLSNIMRDFKTFTSKKIIQNIKEEPESRREWLLDLLSKACEHLKRDQEFKIWQDGYHAEEVFSNKFVYQKLSYIHNNPVKDRTVEKPEDYLYSSARNYAGLTSFLEVELIPHQSITV